VGELDLTQDALVWLVVLLGGCLLVVAVLLLGHPAGSLLFGGHRMHPLPTDAALVMPKPDQLGRFALAILVSFLGVGAVVVAPRAFRAGGSLTRYAPAVVVVGELAVLAVVVWAWRGQNEGVNRLTPIQFRLGDLAVAILIAAGLYLVAIRGWLARAVGKPSRARTVAWIGAATILTSLWLAPELFRSQNLAHSLIAVWDPLQYTFDDFMSVLNGRTPLVNYDTQYASLLPFVTEPLFKVFGVSVGSFTAVMGALSLLSFMCVERSLALIARSERTAFILYVPVLAVSLFTLRHVGGERYFMADYYGVMPARYLGPYVLFWCTVRHLRGLHPRRPTLLLLLAGLVAINNPEFGTPALGGCLLALASARLGPPSGSLRAVRGFLVEVALGLVGSVLVVAVFTLLRSGSLPELSRLTRYEQIYAITGYNMIRTPNAGLHIIIFMTFVAALLVAAVRVRSMQPDRVLTGALVFSGTFGLGAGFYYMGRSLPEVLAALFSAWGLATALLCLLALQALKDTVLRPRCWPYRAFPVMAVLIMMGLLATCIDQFPAPWTQVNRLRANSSTILFDTGPSARFVRAASHPGEHVAMLDALGHVVGREADVIDVSPYSNYEGIVTYEQLYDVLDSLRAEHGDKIFAAAIPPEMEQVLTASGFRVIAQDASSGLSEWSASGEAQTRVR
jgi:hypothetical protein